MKNKRHKAVVILLTFYRWVNVLSKKDSSIIIRFASKSGIRKFSRSEWRRQNYFIVLNLFSASRF